MMGTLAATWEGFLSVESEAAALHRGDPEALAAVLTRYQNRLYRFLLRLTHQPAEAEDLFQQTWLRIAERHRQYNPRQSFEAWLFTVARNLAIDHLRRVRPQSLDIATDEGATLAEQLPSAGLSALDKLLARERAERVLAALQQLPVPYREVLVLRFEEELQLEEIARVVDAPLSTVKTRLARGLERMRRLLAGNTGQEVTQ
jgi:RNA polymerase sigma-70 factor (ECF subfamily)